MLARLKDRGTGSGGKKGEENSSEVKNKLVMTREKERTTQAASKKSLLLTDQVGAIDDAQGEGCGHRLESERL